MSVGAVNKQTGERIPTAGMPAVDSVLSGISTNPVQNRVVKAALDGKADTDMVAADFNAGTSYTAGNYCVQDGKLYKFKNNHSGAWSAADVDEVKITGELSALKSGLNSKSSIKVGGFGSSTSIDIDVTSLGNCIAIIACATYRNYSFYLAKMESSGAYAFKLVASSSDYSPVVSVNNADSLKITNPDNVGGQYTMIF